MFRVTASLLSRPRNIKYTPPPLLQRSGEFRCRRCKFWWHSNFVWVTKQTGTCYQGQQCERCGNVEKPFRLSWDLKKDPGDAHLPPPLTNAEAKQRNRNGRFTPKLLKYSTMNKGRGN